jgi:hypothetical protein
MRALHCQRRASRMTPGGEEADVHAGDAVLAEP